MPPEMSTKMYSSKKMRKNLFMYKLYHQRKGQNKKLSASPSQMEN